MAGRHDETDRMKLLLRVERENPDYYQNYKLMMNDLPKDFSTGQIKHMKKKFQELRTLGEEVQWDQRKQSDQVQQADQDSPDGEKKTKKAKKSIKTQRDLANELGADSPQTIDNLEDLSRVESIEVNESAAFRSTDTVDRTWLLIYATHFQVSPRYLLGVSDDPNEWIATDEGGNPVLDENEKPIYLIQPLAIVLPYKIMSYQCINAMFSSVEGRTLLLCFADFIDMKKEYVEDAVAWLALIPRLKSIKNRIVSDVRNAGGIMNFFDGWAESFLSDSLKKQAEKTAELFTKLGYKNPECLELLWIISSMDSATWLKIAKELQDKGFCCREITSEENPYYKNRSNLRKRVLKERSEKNFESFFA